MSDRESKTDDKSDQVALVRNADFRQIYAIGAVGSWTPYDFRINFYSERGEDESGPFLVNDAQVVLSPRAARELSQWLMRNVREYEAREGKMGERSVAAGGGKVSDQGVLSVVPDGHVTPVKDAAPLRVSPDGKVGLAKDTVKGIAKDLGRELADNIKKELRTEIKTEMASVKKEISSDKMSEPKKQDDPKKSDGSKADSKKSDGSKADSKKSDTKKTEPKKTEPKKTDIKKTDSKSKGGQSKSTSTGRGKKTTRGKK